MNFEFRQKPLQLRSILIAVLTSILIGAVIVLCCGYDPFEIFGALLSGAAGSARNLSTSLRWTTPLLFTGVAAALSFRGGMFNFGIEGQLCMGGLASTLVGVYGAALPGPLLILLMMAAGMAAGALWAVIPAIVRVRLNGSEIVPALMLNYTAANLTEYLVHWYFLASGSHGDTLKTEEIAEQAKLAKIIPGYQITYGFIIGLLVVALFWFLMKKSRLGYDISMSGFNPEFAHYGGVNVDKMRITVMLLSGAIAGLGGAVEVMAVRWRYETEFSPAYGDDGILAALLGSSTPLGTMLGAFFMGFLKAGSLAVERYTEVSRAFATVIKGTVICLVSARMLSQYLGVDALADKVAGRLPARFRKDHVNREEGTT